MVRHYHKTAQLGKNKMLRNFQPIFFCQQTCRFPYKLGICNLSKIMFPVSGTEGDKIGANLPVIPILQPGRWNVVPNFFLTTHFSRSNFKNLKKATVFSAVTGYM